MLQRSIRGKYGPVPHTDVPLIDVLSLIYGHMTGISEIASCARIGGT